MSRVAGYGTAGVIVGGSSKKGPTIMAVLRQVDTRGTVTLPAEMRQGVDLVSVVQRPDGVIELRPQVAVDKAQAWFWTESWQAREREVDVAVASGEVASGTVEELTDALVAKRLMPVAGATTARKRAIKATL